MMLRKTIGLLLALTQFTTAAHAQSPEQTIFYRHTGTPVVRDVDVTPDPDGTVVSKFRLATNENIQVEQFDALEGLSIQALHKTDGSLFKESLSWEMVSGELPPGVETSPSVGKLDLIGAPITSGTWNNIVWKATAPDGTFAVTNPMQLTVVPAASFVLATSNGPKQTLRTVTDVATMNVYPVNAYNDEAIGNEAWVISGDLPPGITAKPSAIGLTFNGVPKTPGNYKLQVSATDSGGVVARTSIEFDVMSGVEIVGRTSASLSQFTETANFSNILRVVADGENYKGDVTWEIVSGSLPPGISTFEAAPGVIQYDGYATQMGTWSNIVWKATLKDGSFATSPPLTIDVVNRVPLSLNVLPGNDLSASTLNGTFSAVIVALNRANGLALPAESWTIDGLLPPGVTYAAINNGLAISGRPTQAGVFDHVVFTAVDSQGASASTVINFTVENGLAVVQSGPNPHSVSQFTGIANSGNSLVVRETNETYTEGDVTWELVSGSLPPGITSSIVANGGRQEYDGAPTQIGTWDNLVWKVTDKFGNSLFTDPISFVVSALPELKIASSQTSFTALTGVDLSGYVTVSDYRSGEQISASSWTVNGLPPGITTSVTGSRISFSGAATTSGQFTATFLFTESTGRTGSISVGFNIAEGLKTVFGLEGGNTNSVQYVNAYTQAANSYIRLVNSTDNSLYTEGATWEIASGALPPGLVASASPDGSTLHISGYVNAFSVPQSYPLTWRIRAANGEVLLTPTQTFQVNARSNLAVYNGGNTLSGVATRAIVNRQITVSNTAFGQGIASSDWTVVGLPDGLTATPNENGLVISGTSDVMVPSRTVTVTAKDAIGQTASASFTLAVAAPIRALMNTSSFDLPRLSGTAATRSVMLVWENFGSATYYQGPLTYTLESGSLPSGLSLVPHPTLAGVMALSGYTSAAAASYTFSARATMANGDYAVSGTTIVRVIAREALALTASGIRSSFTVGQAATGSLTPQRNAYGTPIPSNKWSVTGLPPGITWSVVDGVLSFGGVATTVGTYSVSVTATDAVGGSGGVATYSGSWRVN